MVKPLQGIRVIEMGAFIAGPFASRILAEFGAEVIKIEPPQGDQIRHWGLKSASGESYWSKVQSRNKKCIAVDLHQAAGQDIVRKLIAGADVVMENFKPGTLAKWGLSHDEMKSLNPRLVITSVTGFGQTGPYSDRPGFGNIAESMGGMRYLTGFPDRPPVRIGLSIGDSIAALYAVIGTLLSLRAVDKGLAQGGQVVDVALYESVFSLLEGILPEYVHLGQVRERSGNQLAATAPSNIYPTADGKWIAIGANSDSLFCRLATAMGRDDLRRRADLQNNEGRVRACRELDEHIEHWTRTMTLHDLLDCLTKHGIPAGPIYNIADIAADPQYQARDMFVSIPDSELGQVVMPGVVPRLSDTPGGVEWAGSAIGAHTDAILREIGYSTDEIDQLAAQGVIVCAISGQHHAS